jgi:hypothetical protein
MLAPAGTSAQAGDLAYHAPWGNLAIFYGESGYAAGLLKIGHIHSGIETLAEQRGDFTVTSDRADLPTGNANRSALGGPGANPCWASYHANKHGGRRSHQQCHARNLRSAVRITAVCSETIDALMV